MDTTHRPRLQSWQPSTRPCSACRSGAMKPGDVQRHPVNGRRYVEYSCLGCGHFAIEFEPEPEALPAAAEFARPAAETRTVRDRTGEPVEVPVDRQGRLPT